MLRFRTRHVRVLLAAAFVTALGVYAWHARASANVLLITLDTVRADHLGCYGGRVAQTPTLDRLAREGIRFEYAYSPAPLTLPAHASLMTGLQPLTIGLTDNGMRATRFPVATMAERLLADGYDTAAFVAAFVLNSMHGLDRGFKHYDDGPAEAGDVFQMFRRTAPAVERVDRLLEWLRLPRKQPFFAWLHLYDAHAPYLPPQGFASRYAAHPYDGEIAYLDSQLARVVAYLEREGLIENTLIIVAADHGESLGEHGEVTHGVFLYDATLRVPLIMHWPQKLDPRIEEKPVALVDVMPTLLGLLGLEQQVPSHGVDLFATTTEPRPWRFFAYSDYPHRQYGWAALAALREGALKYIDAPRPELYDTQHDPGELSNLFKPDSAPASATRLADAVSIATRELRAQSEHGAVDGQLNAQQRQRLQSLGYLAGNRAEQPISKEAIDPKDGIHTFGPVDSAFEALATGHLSDAEALFRESLTATPNSLTAQDGLARTLELEGRGAEAEQWHERILAADPEAILSLARLIEIRTRRGDCASARAAADSLRPLLSDATEVNARLSRCVASVTAPHPAPAN